MGSFLQTKLLTHLALLLLFYVSSKTKGGQRSASLVNAINVPSSAKHLSKEVTKIPGDIVFGGLFPLHDAGDERHLCGAIKEEKGIQRMEAMLFALDMINADHRILPNLTIGAHILDTCSRDTYALEQTMDFVKSSLASVESSTSMSEYSCDDGSTPRHTRREPVVGVIGASSSSVSVMVANILRLFQIPQISYASTSVELSDKSRFGFFSRVVPPDSFQARAMVDVVKRFNWSYVSTVASEGDYGEKGIEHFKMIAAKEGVCVAETTKISRNAKRQDFDRIIELLASKANARAVVLFVDEDNCRKLLAASKRAGKVGQFLWLGSDSWGSKTYPVKGQEDAALGAITILPKRKPLNDFDEYFKKLSPLTNHRNPWFVPFWEQHFNCSLESLHKNSGGSRRASSTSKHKKCSGHEKLTSYEQEGLVPFVADAVYAMAFALHNLLLERCRIYHRQVDGRMSTATNSDNFWDRRSPCISEPIKGTDLLAFIRNVSFLSLQGMSVKFNEDGDAHGSYDVFQLQESEVAPEQFSVEQSSEATGGGERFRTEQFEERPHFPWSTSNHQQARPRRVRPTSSSSSTPSSSSSHDKDRFDYVNVGEWVNQRLTLNFDRIKWYFEKRHKDQWTRQYDETLSVDEFDGGNSSSVGGGSTSVLTRLIPKQPVSVCSVPCPPGQYRQYHEGQICCWHCSPCRDYEIIFNETTCVACDNGFVPNDLRLECVKLPIEFMRWTSPWTLVPAGFTGLGIFATLSTLLIFIRFNKTPIIMASGRELCYILLFGILLCYLISLAILTKPSPLTCTVIRIGLNLGLCTCYSAILTKTNRISRIFNRGLNSGLKRPAYTSPTSQAVICCCLVSVQLIFIIAWLIREPPSVREVVYRTGHRQFAVLQCGISAAATVISLIYNMTLIVLCTMYAFKTRKIPENFNEAKYIGFTMYSTCIVWLAFIPIYFGTNNDFKIQVASLAMCISISATVSLGCLFTPKVYICLFQPYKNSRAAVPGHGGISGLPGTFASNSTTSALRFARPTVTLNKPSSSMMSTVVTSAITQHLATSGAASATKRGGHVIPVIAEPSSGDVRTSTTNEGETTTYVSPSPDEEEMIKKKLPNYSSSDEEEEDSERHEHHECVVGLKIEPESDDYDMNTYI